MVDDSGAGWSVCVGAADTASLAKTAASEIGAAMSAAVLEVLGAVPDDASWASELLALELVSEASLSTT
jgi:hypothetical protein